MSIKQVDECQENILNGNDADMFRLSFFEDEYKSASGLDSLKSAMSESFVFKDFLATESDSSDDEFDIYSQDAVVGDFHVFHPNSKFSLRDSELSNSEESRTPTKSLSSEDFSNSKNAAIAVAEEIGLE